MADFDWAGTLKAVHDAGKTEVVFAGQSSDGAALSSYPLADDGNYKFWVFADPYKATVTVEKGKDIEDVEQDVYEAYNLYCLLAGTKTDATFKAQGVRLNGSKFTILRELTKQTYKAKIDGAEHNVTLDSVYILKGKDGGVVIGSKGGYYIGGKFKSDPRADPSLAVAENLAIGFYWAVGPDA